MPRYLISLLIAAMGMAACEKEEPAVRSVQEFVDFVLSSFGWDIMKDDLNSRVAVRRAHEAKVREAAGIGAADLAGRPAAPRRKDPGPMPDLP